MADEDVEVRIHNYYFLIGNRVNNVDVSDVNFGIYGLGSMTTIIEWFSMSRFNS